MVTVALLVLAGAPLLCVGSPHGAVFTCAERFSRLPSEVDGRLVAMDAVGNTADLGAYCSWRGVRVQAELDGPRCDEAKARLEQAVGALTRAELVGRDEWPLVLAGLSRVVLHPGRVLEVPRGEQLVEGVYVPATGEVHLTATLEAAPHELFHAVLYLRAGSSEHDAFNRLVDFVQGAFASRYRGRPVL